MANWPRVDANEVEAAPPWARANRAVGFTYEPGSTFKSITVAGALEDGSSTRAPCSRSVRRSRSPTASSTRRTGPAASFSVADILARSSNVGAVKIGLRARRDGDSTSWVRRFGFGELTDVPLPGESQGIVPQVKDYSGSSMGNLPIGQGLAVTPMQMARRLCRDRKRRQAAEAAARRWTRRPPRGRRVISARTAARLRRMLEGVLGPDGTAPRRPSPGTTSPARPARRRSPRTAATRSRKFVASFIGFAPAATPSCWWR